MITLDPLQFSVWAIVVFLDPLKFVSGDYGYLSLSLAVCRSGLFCSLDHFAVYWRGLYILLVYKLLF